LSAARPAQSRLECGSGSPRRGRRAERACDLRGPPPFGDSALHDHPLGYFQQRLLPVGTEWVRIAASSTLSRDEPGRLGRPRLGRVLTCPALTRTTALLDADTCN
jgi:hypothetical protein